LMVAATSAFIWALHYHLLGERLAALLAMISGTRNTVAGWVHAQSRRVRIGLSVLACALLSGLGTLVWSGPLTILPTFAACFSTTASFWLVDRAFRRALLVSDSCWLVFGVLAGSVAAGLAALISLSINLWTMRKARLAPDAPAQNA
ncbi:MAG TPA: YgjV family protein, partial [Burkholderiaceae bacterium]|nr:YgjV family protein [Burkholderiaceae bacterium]